MTLSLVILGLAIALLAVEAIKSVAKKQPPQIISEWQYKPYALEPGHKYVFELVANEFQSREAIEQFKGWLKDNGINAHLVFTRTGNGIKPLEVKTHRESKQ